jgi:hypothetical protein
MEYIFEDDVGELGSEVEAYCQKCRTDGPHTVITRYEDEVRQVQCGTCGHVHVFKPARPEPTEEDLPDAAAGGSRRRQVKKLSWDEAMRSPASNKAKAYGFRDAYRQGDYLDHPKFGKGYVNEVVDDTKIEAVFKDGARVLIHNRKDLAAVDSGKGARHDKGQAAHATRPATGRAAKPAATAKAPAKSAKAPAARAGHRATKAPARKAKPVRAAAKPKTRKPKAARPTRRPARARGRRR